MLVQKNHAIVFCPENQRLGQEITSDLSKAGYQLNQYLFSDNLEEGSLYVDLSGSRGQVVVLLTDNFLRNTACLYRCLPVLKELHAKNRLIAVLANGIERSEDGSQKEFPTSLDNVNQMLVYMKYWHSRYLDLRDKIAHLQTPDDSLELEMQAAKEISSNISAVLNFFRELPLVSLEQFFHNTYELFFNKLNDHEGHEKLKRVLRKSEVFEDQVTLVDIITKSSKAILEENTELNTEFYSSSGAPTFTSYKPDVTDPSEMVEQIIEELEEEDEEELLMDHDDDDADNFSELNADLLLGDLFGEDELDAPLKRKKSKPPKKAFKLKPPPSTEEILNVVMGLFESNNTQQALGFLEGAMERAPRDDRLRFYHAFALARYSKNLKVAANELDQIIQSNPNFWEAFFLRGQLAEHLKEYDLAVSCYQEVLKLNPDFHGAHYRLGLLYVFQQHCDGADALYHLQKAIQSDRYNAEAHYCLGTLYAQQLNDPEQAIHHFMVTKQLNPNHRFAWYDIAVLYHKMGKGDLAYHYYQHAIKINPELCTPHNDRVFTLGKTQIGTKKSTQVPIKATKHPELIDRVPASAKKENPETETSEKMNAKPKTVLITGATAGIGMATAELFAKNGCRVIITGRRLERLERQKEQYQNEFNAEVLPLHFDVRNLNAVKNALENLPEEWKQVDVLINNAGLSKGLAPIHEGNPEDWDTMIDTNIKGLLYMTRLIAPQMVARRSGHIINVASSAGKEVYPGGNVYCATKFAVEALTKAMRLDLFKYNVKVSQVSPGHVEETEFARVRFDWDLKKAAAVYENFQPLKAADIAEAIYYIATRPPHVNIQDIYMFSTQQAGSNFIDRSGR